MFFHGSVVWGIFWASPVIAKSTLWQDILETVPSFSLNESKHFQDNQDSSILCPNNSKNSQLNLLVWFHIELISEADRMSWVDLTFSHQKKKKCLEAWKIAILTFATCRHDRGDTIIWLSTG